MRAAAPAKVLAALVVTAALGCGKEAPPAPAAPAPATPPPVPAPVAAAPAADPAEEACGQILLVSYAGAAHAAPTVTRDKAAAKARADELLAKAKAGADFAALAKENSDAPSSAPSGGIMGTFARSEWPAIHAPLEATVFGLAAGALAPEVVEAPYGYVLVKRCPVEKARSRHVLVRYQGAKNAGPEITRSKKEAFDIALAAQRRVTSGDDFAVIARTMSEDSSAERGGDVGTWGRGRLSAAYEEALFALPEGGISTVVESENGYHVIQRLALGAAPAAPAPAE
jgi:peptidyl-prolyl cis-trans isomerase SurA